MSSDLKPCPFCGSAAKLHPGTRGYRAVVECTRKDCETTNPERFDVNDPDHDSAREAVENWNHRADSAVPSSHVSETDGAVLTDERILEIAEGWGLHHAPDTARHFAREIERASSATILREALARLVAILNLGTIPQFNRSWEAIEFDDAMKAARSALAGMNASGDPTERPG